MAFAHILFVRSSKWFVGNPFPTWPQPHFYCKEFRKLNVLFSPKIMLFIFTITRKLSKSGFIFRKCLFLTHLMIFVTIFSKWPYLILSFRLMFCVNSLILKLSIGVKGRWDFICESRCLMVMIGWNICTRVDIHDKIAKFHFFQYC